MNPDFVVLGNCWARPRGWRRIVNDLLCRLTGHLLWRSMNTSCLNPTGSLPYYGTHCKRCWKWGYVEGDYRQ